MPQRKPYRTITRGLMFLAISAVGSALASDELQEFDRLARQFAEEYNVGKYPEAEQTAQNMCRLAAGPLKKQPALLRYASN